MSKMKEVKIIKDQGFTIYCVGISDRFRIKQISDNEFIVQKLFFKETTKGYLWWKKTTINECWQRVDKHGVKYYSLSFRSLSINNHDFFKTYESFYDAKKWIEDYNKYPIYH
jgi:hypothetical protein